MVNTLLTEINIAESSKKFLAILKKQENLLIYIKGSPDPDAIASAFMIKSIGDYYKTNISIHAEMNVSLPQNSAMIKMLNIPIKFESKIATLLKCGSYCVVDHQSSFIDGISQNMDCVIHIDHHDVVDDNTESEFRIIAHDVGSTSTILTLFLQELNLSMDREIMERICTALIYGIQTDTDKYEHSNKFDYQAVNFLSPFVNTKILNEISGIPLSKTTLGYLGMAIEHQVLYKDWLISGIGFIDQKHRDSIAIIADFLLKRDKVNVVIVFAGIEDLEKKSLFLDASIRSKKETMNLNSLIKEITADGGARRFKGAYQVNLDYFAYCPDKNQLWDVIFQTTVETLKTRKDKLYQTEIKSAFKRFKNKISQTFN
jgi:nanoRNase/pAp phosphatase (c-di-AMP/oligoRNAs hydrolase)